MRILVLLLFQAIIFVPIRAQFFPDSISAHIPQRALKYSPLHMVNFYPSVQFALEYKVLNRFSAQTDLGYVYDGGYFNERFQNKRGMKVRQEFRWYYDLYHKSSQAYYYAAELYLNIIDFNRAEIRVECFDLDCNSLYERSYYYLVRNWERGFSLKNGFIKYLNKEFFLDFNFGLTLRFIRYIKPDLPRAFIEPDEWGWFGNTLREDDRIGLLPAFNLRLGYRFK